MFSKSVLEMNINRNAIALLSFYQKGYGIFLYDRLSEIMRFLLLI